MKSDSIIIVLLDSICDSVFRSLGVDMKVGVGKAFGEDKTVGGKVKEWIGKWGQASKRTERKVSKLTSKNKILSPQNLPLLYLINRTFCASILKFQAFSNFFTKWVDAPLPPRLPRP